MKKYFLKTNWGALKKEILIFLLLLVVYLFFRLNDLEYRTSFALDQEDLAFRAKELLSGDPVLLGPITSFNGFAIGPFFIYIWAFFSTILKEDPLAGAFASVMVGATVLFALFFTGKLLLGKKAAIFVSLIYTFSFTFYNWDINPWAPSLFHLSQTLIIIGSYFAHKNNLGFIFVALGISIGFSSHITIFISVAALIFYWMIKKPIKPGRKIIFSSLLIIFFGTLPNLVYDITHRFENTHRLLTTFSDSQPENVANFVKILVSLIKQTSFIFIPFGTIELSFIIFFYIIILSIGSYINNKDSRLLLFLIFIFGPALVFIFWSGNFSEYYLMSSMIPFCFLVSLLYKKYANHIKVPLTILALVFIYKNYLAWRDYFRPINLLAMKEVVKLAVDKASPGSFGVSLTTEPGYGFGYKYLFQYYGTNPDIPPKKGEERIITIVVPPGFHGVHAKIEKDGIGLLWEGI